MRSGFIKEINLTSPGEGYERRPNITIDTTTGSQANIQAQLGVDEVTIVDGGANYIAPSVDITTSTGQGAVLS